MIYPNRIVTEALMKPFFYCLCFLFYNHTSSQNNYINNETSHLGQQSNVENNRSTKNDPSTVLMIQLLCNHSRPCISGLDSIKSNTIYEGTTSNITSIKAKPDVVKRLILSERYLKNHSKTIEKISVQVIMFIFCKIVLIIMLSFDINNCN